MSAARLDPAIARYRAEKRAHAARHTRDDPHSDRAIIARVHARLNAEEARLGNIRPTALPGTKGRVNAAALEARRAKAGRCAECRGQLGTNNTTGVCSRCTERRRRPERARRYRERLSAA